MEEANVTEMEANLKNDERDPVVSKKQMRRKRRAEKIEEFRKAKKEITKEQKKKRRLEASVEISERVHDEEINFGEKPQNEEGKQPSEYRLRRKADAKQQFLDKCEESFSVIIDCDFESHHGERPLKSLGQQINFCYGFNKQFEAPCHVFLTKVQSRLRDQIAKCHAENWVGVSILDGCYLDYPELFTKRRDERWSQRPPRELVYLTSDATETLTDLDPNCAYIIGGIVDRNSLKGITYKKGHRTGSTNSQTSDKRAYEDGCDSCPNGQSCF